jgi:serine/threonine-protein kinase
LANCGISLHIRLNKVSLKRHAKMNCPSCNAALPDAAMFCMECGAQVAHGSGQSASDPLHDALASALSGQYDIMRLLGRGGMGAIYLARDKTLDRLVAVKVLLPETSDTHARERFRREARTAANMTHPNIVPLYTFGEAEGVMYFVMGYVRGESLSGQARQRPDR